MFLTPTSDQQLAGGLWGVSVKSPTPVIRQQPDSVNGTDNGAVDQFRKEYL